MKQVNKIREYRKLLIVRQKDFADLLGVTPVCLANYENGNREPNIQMIKTIISWFKRLGLEEITGEKVTFEMLWPDE